MLCWLFTICGHSNVNSQKCSRLTSYTLGNNQLCAPLLFKQKYFTFLSTLSGSCPGQLLPKENLPNPAGISLHHCPFNPNSTCLGSVNWSCSLRVSLFKLHTWVFFCLTCDLNDVHSDTSRCAGFTRFSIEQVVAGGLRVGGLQGIWRWDGGHRASQAQLWDCGCLEGKQGLSLLDSEGKAIKLFLQSIRPGS